MSIGEVIGLALSMALLGAAVGAWASWVAGVWRDRRDDRRRSTRAWEQWLAARLTLTRCSLSFAHAFRGLREPSGGKERFSVLRHREAQRARAAWCEAMTELERVEAVLLIGSGDPDMRTKLERFRPVSPARLRAAINGRPEDVRQLVLDLRAMDDESIALARLEADHHRGSQRALMARMTRAIVFAQSMLTGGSNASHRRRHRDKR